MTFRVRTTLYFGRSLNLKNKFQKSSIKINWPFWRWILIEKIYLLIQSFLSCWALPVTEADSFYKKIVQYIFLLVIDWFIAD